MRKSPYIALKLKQLQAAARRLGRGAAQGGDREAADQMASLQAAATVAERPEWQTPASAPPLQAVGEVLTNVVPKALSYALGGEYHACEVAAVPRKAGDFLLGTLLPALQVQGTVLQAASDVSWLLVTPLGMLRALRTTAPALLELQCHLEKVEDGERRGGALTCVDPGESRLLARCQRLIIAEMLTKGQPQGDA